MEETQIVVDVQASPLSKSRKLEGSLLSESSPLSEAPKVVGLKAPLQRQLATLWGNANEAENFTIFRTPHSISQSKKKLFEPSVISIGPFHHGQKHLRALEDQKRRFLRDFLSRNDNISLDLCISEMKSLETRTRRCYSETFDDLDSDTFVEMMLLDGCFVLEYFSKRMEAKWKSIREVGWNSHFIRLDLLLQENQIPFFIVDKLYELIHFRQEFRKIFVKYIACCLLPEEYILPAPPAETSDTINSRHSLAEILDPPSEIHHLTHLCYHYLVPNPEKAVVLSSKSIDLTRIFSANRIIKGLFHQFRSRLVRRRSPHSTPRSLSGVLPNSTVNISSMVVRSATELKQKGLKFTQQSNPRHMLDISFEYGVLKIPRLAITDDTKPLFANLLAFEHSKYGNKYSPFGRFLSFLDKLINTANDVTILQECEILENWLGSEEELADFLNHATEGNMLQSDHYLVEVYTEVQKYTESRWHRHRAKLIRDYFGSPWAIISLIAAFILLVLTLVQSFFAVFSYFVPPGS
ncbi:UPF0481 protein At3g47200-like [Carex rostrata]